MIEMNQIINADCMDILKDIPDKYFELAIVDPPYSELCNLHGGQDRKYGWSNIFIENKHLKWNKKPDKKYFDELFRISKNQIIWGGNYFINYLYPSQCWLIWNKIQRNFSLADGELAWTSFNQKVKIFDYARINTYKNIHPTQKPVVLYKWILRHYAKKGDKIIDTHMGSGSSVIACIDIGFEYLAIEKDKEYYESANKRINDFKLQNKFNFEQIIL